jgi:hypothetical protein
MSMVFIPALAALAAVRFATYVLTLDQERSTSPRKDLSLGVAFALTGMGIVLLGSSSSRQSVPDPLIYPTSSGHLGHLWATSKYFLGRITTTAGLWLAHYGQSLQSITRTVAFALIFKGLFQGLRIARLVSP